MAPQDARRVAVRLGGAAVIVGFLAGITGCGGDAATGDPGDTVGTIARVDHQVDCLDADGWSFEGALDADAAGEAATPEEALKSYAVRLVVDDLGVSLEVDGATGSLISAGRELVVMSAVEAPAGGWVVTTAVGCSEVPQPPAR